jgi:hypothetical protein
LHSDLNHVSDIVMRDSTFTSAYGASGAQRKVVEALAGLFNIVFIGTDFCDSDLRRVWQECKDIFQPGTGTLRFALTQLDGEAAPTRNPVLDSLGICPIYYSTSGADRQTVLDQGPVWASPRALPSRHAHLWQMVADLRGLTERYVSRAYLEKVLQADLETSYSPGEPA